MAVDDPALARAAVAYGRYLRRTALWMLLVAATSALLAIAALVSAYRYVQAVEIVAWSIVVASVLAASTAAIAALRLIRSQLPLVGAHPEGSLERTMQTGARWPKLASAVIFTGLAGLTIVDFMAHRMIAIILACFVVVRLVRYIQVGPSGWPGLESVRVDGSGIRLVSRGVLVPWESISRIWIARFEQVAVAIDGPLVATGDQRRRWTQHSLETLTAGSVLTITTPRPELVMWVAHWHRRRLAVHRVAQPSGQPSTAS